MNAEAGEPHTINSDFWPETPLELRPDELLYDPAALAAFAEHVEWVRNNGDALDMTALSRTTMGAKLLGTSAVCLPLTLEMSTGVGPWTLASFLSFVGGSAVAVKSAFTVSRGIKHARGEDHQNTLGEEYELYRTAGEGGGGPSLAMRYYGPRREFKDAGGDLLTMPSHMKAIAALAVRNGIGKLIVNDEIASHITPHYDTQSMEEVLESLKGLSVPGGYLDDSVVVHTPREWLEMPPYQKPREAETGNRTEQLLQKLQSLHPRHRVLAVYHDPAYNERPEARLSAMLRAVLGAIEAEFSNIGRQTASKREQALSLSEDVKGECVDALHKSVYEQVSMSSDADITLSVQGVVLEISRLEEALGLEAHQVAALLERPDQDPRKATQLLLGLLGRELLLNLDKDRPANGFGSQKPANTWAMVVRGGKRVYKELITDQPVVVGAKLRAFKRPLLQRLAAGLLITGLVGGTSYWTAKTMEESYEQARQQAKQTIATSQGIEPARLVITDKELDAYIEGGSPLLKTWGYVRSTYNSLKDESGSGSVPAGLPSPLPSGDAAIGNINRTPWLPEIDWQVRQAGDISALGYWATQTSYRMEYDTEARLLTWDGPFKLDSERVIAEQSLAQTTQGGEYLEVARQLAIGDAWASSPNVIPISVREGTRPVAANLDGAPLTLLYYDDGTYLLKAGKPIEGGVLRYWLREDSYAPKAHAWNPNRAPIVDNMSQATLDKIVQLWEARIPGFSTKTPAERVTAMETYVRENFDYRLQPLEDETAFSPANLDLFTSTVLRDEKASCNVDATLRMIGAAPTSAEYPLTTVTGYFNTPGQPTALSSRELHMWTANAEGDRQDGTPGNNILPEDAAYLNGYVPEAQPPAKPWWLLGVSALNLVGMAAYMNWPRLRRTARRAAHRKTERLEKKLMDKGADALYKTAHIVDALLYDPGQDVQGALQRAERPASSWAPQPPDPREKLRRADVNSKHVQQRLRTYRRTAPPKELAALKQAERILRLANKLERRRPADQ